MKYAKNTKNMTITKRLLCLLLCFVMGVMCVLFSGCSLEDNLENEKLDKSFFENYVGGFNTVYASSQYGTPRKIDDNLNLMLDYITQGLLYNYGNVDPSFEKNIYGNYVFPDSIRMLVYSANGNDSGGTVTSNLDIYWKWFINPYLQGAYRDSLLGKMRDEDDKLISYQEWKDDVIANNLSNYSFPQYMEDLFQIVLYEIMLGYTPTKIKVEFEEKVDCYIVDKYEICDKYVVKISDSPNKELINTVLYGYLNYDSGHNESPDYTVGRIERESINAYIKQLAEEYKNSTLYNGLTKQNADKLIDYILKEIIGETVVNYDYSTFSSAPVNYRNYVSTIAYLIYSQTYDGSGDLWEYEYSSGSVKLSYKFTPAQRVKAMSVELLKEDGVDGKTAYSGSETNPTIITEIQAGFSAKPATFVRYYEGETFFGDDVEDQFAGRPYVEYQSVVIDPAYTLENAKTRGLELEAGFCFNFMTKNKNLKIAMKVRYFIYDSATGTGQLYEFECDTVNFTDGATVYTNANGETCYENDFEASIDTAELEKYNPSLVRHESTENDPDVTHFTVPFFGSSEIIRSASKSEVSLSVAKNIANLYKVIESEKGYGGLTVLDEKRVKTSFYEVVLDVIKSPEDTNTDYRFSMVLSNTVLSPGIW